MLEKLKARRFALLWGGLAVAALAVHHFWTVHANFLGVVETRTHKLGTQEDGRIRSLPVALGDEVQAGQLVAELDSTELEERRAWLLGEVARIEEVGDGDRQRFTLEYEKLRLQRDADAAGIGRRRAELAAKKGELAALDLEIEQRRAAERAGLGRSRDSADLRIRREGVAGWVDEEEVALRTIARTPAGDGISRESVVDSMLSGRAERMGELKLAIKTLDSRIHRRRVLAPCAGRVVNVSYLPGDVVEAFSTIVTIEEPTAAFVDAYVPEASEVLPHLGQRVVVHPRRAGTLQAAGAIVFVDPGYSRVPDRLAFRNITYWARKFRVELDAGHQLMPGEATRIELLGDIDLLREAHAATSPAAPMRRDGVTVVTADAMAELAVPHKLEKKTSVEPSGIVWLADIERYAIASDDTSRRGRDHQPWVLLMDATGELNKKPAKLRNVDAANDLESIAMAPDGSLYMVSSQSISKRGNRPANRQQLLKVSRDGRDFEVVGAAAILPALAAYEPDALRLLGLGVTDPSGQLILNIEGAAWWNGGLLLGLKQPRPDGGALLWRLTDPDGFLASGELRPGQLSLFGKVDLRTPDGRPAGISDLVVDDRGELYALSTLPNTPFDEQLGGMHRIAVSGPDELGVEPLYAFPRLKPEGICTRGRGHFTIVFDTDDERPIPYLTLELPQR